MIFKSMDCVCLFPGKRHLHQILLLNTGQLPASAKSPNKKFNDAPRESYTQQNAVHRIAGSYDDVNTVKNKVNRHAKLFCTN